MKKDSKHKFSIITEYLSNRFSFPTEQKVQQWIIDTDSDREVEEASFTYFNSLDVASDRSAYQALNRVNAKIGMKSGVRKRILYPTFTRVAAVFLLLFALSGILYYYSRDRLVEIYVANGDEKHLFLPDGTEVWLNSGTTLQYPQNASAKERKVFLRGEACFSVVRDEVKPFIVETGKLSVKVLGTRFNVKAYEGDERTVTTLKSGKIEVKTTTKESFILDPNQQLSYDHKTSDVHIREVSVDELDGWENGRLIFSDVPLDEIVKTIERKFNVRIEMDAQLWAHQELYTVKFIKDDSLSDVLRILSDVIGFSYQQNGDVIMMSER